MEDAGLELSDAEDDDTVLYLYKFLQIREVRIILAVIGIIAAFMPWIYTDSYGVTASINLIDYIRAADTGVLLLMFILAYLVGLVVCTFKWELSTYVGVPIVLIGLVGTVVELPKADIPGSIWGAGAYFASAVSLVLLFIPIIGIKRAFEEVEEPLS